MSVAGFCVPLAHVGGIPVEESLLALGPAVIVAAPLVAGTVRAWLRLHVGRRRARRER